MSALAQGCQKDQSAVQQALRHGDLLNIVLNLLIPWSMLPKMLVLRSLPNAQKEETLGKTNDSGFGGLHGGQQQAGLQTESRSVSGNPVPLKPGLSGLGSQEADRTLGLVVSPLST